MTDNDYTPRIPDALPPGYRFDEFEIQEVIDSTNAGIIYRAWDHQLERPIAIREFMPRALTVRSDNMRLVLRSKQDSTAFNAGLNSFIQEARQLAHFNHPNLLQVLRFWTLNETAYTATLFYSGITLAELHQQQPDIIDEAWIRRMLPMLCSALAALHEGDYIHRDLSLKSVQIQDNGIPLLLNFAASRRGVNGISDESKTLLHPGFAPLEQYTEDLENQLGPWTDIYALGAVLYTLITGTSPQASVARSIQDTCVPLAQTQPNGYSQSLLLAVDRALALKPEDRPQSIAEFAALAEIPLGDIGELSGAKKPGTMLVAVEEEEADAGALPFWKRYKSPLQIAAGVVAGIIVGALIFGRAPQTPADEHIAAGETTAAKSKADAAPAPAAAAANGLIARVYIHINDGEEMEVNGKPQKNVPTTNGYGILQLPAGKYEITLRNQSQSRSVTVAVDKPGTWLLNPQQ
ncbi:serine/threonine protein kinase [Enterobacteriaceae bacterium H20N1]|uniref:Serine/threonine protein kinase n=1 Tax=Dryocola boscaweniae TaxID=2925397 RepID=A0A9X2WAA6_9ENTR|nr:serine/threonine-protein kinase [Dryocola boscaweniae]MCT4703562.1 serine/threonine protein kinase [Dryocola boscaweniae]MCT4713931.1 serine/threonine protein kinase [Dryocola boscaweniae]MCT4720730.1 serine/threonine protein kinase [Dryocola boscaweniae]